MKIPALFVALSAGFAAAMAHGFELSSSDIADGKMMPKAQEYQGFGCSGGNHSPQLSWHDAPAGTRSFAVTVYDPDAPTGSGWWHWMVYDVPATDHSLPGNAGDSATGLLPKGAQQHRNDYSSIGFGGACPPVGDPAHHYQFKVYALDVEHLDVAPDSSAALVGFMLHAHSLGVAELDALYQRQ